jgi:hypothetical protein
MGAGGAGHCLQEAGTRIDRKETKAYRKNGPKYLQRFLSRQEKKKLSD